MIGDVDGCCGCVRSLELVQKANYACVLRAKNARGWKTNVYLVGPCLPASPVPPGAGVLDVVVCSTGHEDLNRNGVIKRAG